MAGDRNWWLWCAHLAEGEAEQFVYALLAPTGVSVSVMSPEEQEIAAGSRLIIREAILASAAGQAVLDALDCSLIDLSAAGIVMQPLEVLARRVTVQEALGDPAAMLRAHYSLPDLSRLTRAGLSLRALLEIVEERLKLPLAGRLCSHVGNLDVVAFENDPPEPPVSVAIEPTDGGAILVVRRREPWVAQSLWGHLVASATSETLLDRLFPLPPGQDRVEQEVPLEIGSFELTLFEAAGGARRFRARHSLTKSFLLNAQVQGRTVELDDPLTQRMRGASKEARQQASARHDYSTSRSEIAAHDRLIENHASRIAARLEREQPGILDRFFERTLDDEWGALAHFIDLLDGGRMKYAILVDPFFGEAAFLRLVMRLGSTDLDLTVITSWGTTDPDTADPINPTDAAAAISDNVSRLRRMMDRLEGLIAVRLRLLNLLRGTEPAFHDRYLLLQPQEGEPTVYLLSNSINGMAVNWPFCMSTLSGAAATRARDYVEGLARGQDITTGGRLEANFEWPSPHS